jgi:hypothetical protein
MFNHKPHAALEVRALQSEQVTYVICVCYQLIYWLGKQCSRDGERTYGVTALYSWPLCIEKHDLKQLCTIFWFKVKGAKKFYVWLEGSEVIWRLISYLLEVLQLKMCKFWSLLLEYEKTLERSVEFRRFCVFWKPNSTLRCRSMDFWILNTHFSANRVKAFLKIKM